MARRFSCSSPAAQTRLAARLIANASTVVLNMNEITAWNATSRRSGFAVIDTSEVCDVAPIEVVK